MLAFLRPAALLAILFVGACHQAADEVQPTTITGTWRLTVSGGGITGVMEPVPAGSDCRLVFGPDSAYARYDNGKLTEASTYQLRSQPSYPGGPATQVLVLKTSNNYGYQPRYAPYYVTEFSARELHFSTPGGCAFNYVYEKLSSTSLPTGSR